jgi:hypothetical protein
MVSGQARTYRNCTVMQNMHSALRPCGPSGCCVAPWHSVGFSYPADGITKKDAGW